MLREPIPRETAIDQLVFEINGANTDRDRRGYMSRERAAKTLDCFKGAMSNALTPNDFAATNGVELRKDVSIATGLTYYDLRAPAFNLFPTVTPLRNAIGRTQRPNPGDAAHWKSVTATTGSGWPYMGWVPEGQRAPSMSYTTQNVTATYATLGEEDSLTDEALFASQGFEDESAMVQLRLMLKTFIKEEAAILGGNHSLSLGTPTAPTTSSPVAADGTITPATYNVIAVALTQEGYQNSTVAGGVATTATFTGNDGKTYSLNGGCSNQSAPTAQAVAGTNYLAATVPIVTGAVAYAWYVGVGAAEKLQAITTINSVVLKSVSTTNQAVTAVAGDYSKNATAFDGLLTTAFASGSAYIRSLGTGVAGVGTTLTASGSGSVVEIDDAMLAMWNNYKISATVMYVNAAQLREITNLVLSSSSGPLLRFDMALDDQGSAEYRLTAAGVIAFYFNPYTPDGGVKIPVKVHPNLAPGTIVLWAEKLPPWYVSNQVPMVAQMLTRQDYYTEVWPKTSRQQYYGTYTQETLAVYAPFAMGIINNIA